MTSTSAYPDWASTVPSKRPSIAVTSSLGAQRRPTQIGDTYHALARLVGDMFGKKLLPVGFIGPLRLESEPH